MTLPPRSSLRSSVLVLLMVLVLVPWALGCGSNQRRSLESGGEEASSRPPAPDFTLVSISGEEISLRNFLGRPVVLVFWATWCPSCVRETPELVSFHSSHKEDVAVVIVALQSPAEEVGTVFARYGTDLVVVLDQSGKVASSYGVRAVPTLFIVDRSGSIADVRVGGLTAEEIEAAVDAIR